MHDHVVTSSGVRVWKTPEVHPLLQHTDTTHPWFSDRLAETYSRGRARGLPRILSENSEDARTWYYFSPLLSDSERRTEVLDRLIRQSFPDTVSPWVLDAIPSAELVLWPKLSPPPSRPQREGPSEPDVLVRLGEVGLMLVEAKYLSGISERTTHDDGRDQLIRLLDVGSWHAGEGAPRDQDAGRSNSFVIILQYGDAETNAEEIVARYRGRPDVIARALSYRNELTPTDFGRLGRSLAFVRWLDPMNG